MNFSTLGTVFALVILLREFPLIAASTSNQQVLVGFSGSARSVPFSQTPWSPPPQSTKLSSNFLIQMKNISFEAIRTSNFSYYVLDAQAANFTNDQTALLKAQNKTLLAYLSLGVGERFRRYWQGFWLQSPPDFLITPFSEDSAYTGKYRVQFWKTQWQRIVLRFMRDTILPLRFSGLFLDGLDAYQYYTDDDRVDARVEMINFIRLAQMQATTLAPGSKVFANNVPELYDSEIFRGSVDGLGISDTWYRNDTDLNTTNPQLLANVLNWTRQARRDGKVVLAVDWPDRSEDVCSFFENCLAEDFFCQVTDYAMTGVAKTCERRQPTTSVAIIKLPSNGKFPPTSGSTSTSTSVDGKVWNFFSSISAFLILSVFY